jgi:hypothetical protein
MARLIYIGLVQSYQYLYLICLILSNILLLNLDLTFVYIGPIESSGEVLLTYASLYVLAEKWGVNSLKILVLSKLH